MILNFIEASPEWGIWLNGPGWADTRLIHASIRPTPPNARWKGSQRGCNTTSNWRPADHAGAGIVPRLTAKHSRGGDRGSIARSHRCAHGSDCRDARPATE